MVSVGGTGRGPKGWGDGFRRRVFCAAIPGAGERLATAGRSGRGKLPGRAAGSSPAVLSGCAAGSGRAAGRSAQKSGTGCDSVIFYPGRRVNGQRDATRGVIILV